MASESPRELVPRVYHPSFGRREPVMAVRAGDTIITSCLDAHGLDATGEAISPEQIVGPPEAQREIANPLTGPFLVEGAEPGDALAVRLEEITPNRDWAWSLNRPFFGFFSTEDRFGPTSFTPPVWPPESEWEVRWELDLERGLGRLALRQSRLKRIEIPLHPFLGCIGTAPECGEVRTSITSSRHGGNMDCPEVRAGATVYLPVFEPGGYLFIGDCHAAQGDGELCGTALEVSCEVRLSVDVVKGWQIRWPRIEDEEHIMAVGNVRPLDAAYAIAHVELLDWLVRLYQFEPFEALQVVSQAGSARIGNVVDPNYSVVARFPKHYLP